MQNNQKYDLMLKTSKLQNRFRSPVVWSAMIALILFILKNWGLLAPIGLTEDSYKELTSLIFAVLSAFAYFNNPTNKKRF